VSFVKNQKIDLIHRDERVVKTLTKNFSSADNDHVFREVLLPKLLAPQITAHISTEHVHWLIEVRFEDSMLLKDQLNGINQEERDPLWFAHGPIFQLLRKDVSKKEDSDQSLAGACFC